MAITMMTVAACRTRLMVLSICDAMSAAYAAANCWAWVCIRVSSRPGPAPDGPTSVDLDGLEPPLKVGSYAGVRALPDSPCALPTGPWPGALRSRVRCRAALGGLPVLPARLAADLLRRILCLPGLVLRLANRAPSGLRLGRS